MLSRSISLRSVVYGNFKNMNRIERLVLSYVVLSV